MITCIGEYLQLYPSINLYTAAQMLSFMSLCDISHQKTSNDILTKTSLPVATQDQIEIFMMHMQSTII